MLREEVLRDPAEIEYISVTNGDIGGEIEVEAIVKGMRDSEGLYSGWTNHLVNMKKYRK